MTSSPCGAYVWGCKALKNGANRVSTLKVGYDRPRMGLGGVGEKLPHAVGVTGSEATARGAEPPWGALQGDGLGRPTSWLYRNAADDATIVGFGHDYDKVGNPKYEVRVHQGNYGDEYSYDKLYRLTRDVYDDSTPTTPTADPAAKAPCLSMRAAAPPSRSRGRLTPASSLRRTAGSPLTPAPRGTSGR